MTEDHASDPTPAGDAKPRKRSGKLWILLGVLLALVAVVVGVWEYTSTPGFCASCHVIRPSVDGWRDSAHADEAECMDCHADEGFSGEFIAHIGGLEEVYMLWTEKPEAEDIRGHVPIERCLSCHEEDWAELPEDHPTREAPCGVCHRDTAHTNEKPLYEPAKEGE